VGGRSVRKRAVHNNNNSSSSINNNKNLSARDTVDTDRRPPSVVVVLAPRYAMFDNGGVSKCSPIKAHNAREAEKLRERNSFITIKTGERLKNCRISKEDAAEWNGEVTEAELEKAVDKQIEKEGPNEDIPDHYVHEGSIIGKLAGSSKKSKKKSKK
jgi:hypothetical protein